MGQILSTRLEWSASANGESTLVTSLHNEETLHDLINSLELVCTQYKEDAQTEFRRPLQFVTTLKPSNFEGAAEFIVQQSGVKDSKGSVSSTAVGESGQPLLQIQKLEKEKYIAKVYDLVHLQLMLHMAGAHKLKEVQNILQGNREPLNTISGLSGDATTLYLEAFDSLAKLTEAEKIAEGQKSTQRLLRLLLVLNALDLQLLKKTVKTLSSETSLSVGKVEEELALLKSFTGNTATSPLRSIAWESDVAFSNGYHSPPWRQVHGEFGYIEVQTVDADKFCITASRKGFFVNKGYVADEKGSERLDYDAASDIFPSLIDLLRSKSAHFSKNIDLQDYQYKGSVVKTTSGGSAGPLRSTGSARTKAAAANAAATADQNGNAADENSDEEQTSPHAGSRKAVVGAKKSTTKRSEKRQQQPSLKWQNLNLEDHDATLKKKDENNKATHHERRDGEKSKKHTGGNPKHDEEELSDSDSDGSSEEETQEKRNEGSELPAEYWQIQKLVKYLKVGNQTATIIAICSLKDFDLRNETNQLAIREVGGLETLVNLLSTEDPKCKIGSLQILKEISQNVQLRRAIADLNGMEPLVELLKDSNEELRCLAAETISHCAKYALNRRSVRQFGGIKKLVRLLKSPNENVARGGALALCSLSKSSRNKEAIRSAGAIPLLADLLTSSNETLLIPVVGILQECASNEQYRIAIRTSGMIKFLVENLSSKNEELQAHCASAIFKCAEDDETRKLVHTYGGLAPIVNLLDNVGHKELLIAATGAVWKCAQSLENVAAFNRMNTIKKLVSLLESQPEDVLVNVVGALSACAQSTEGRVAIRESNGITLLVGLLTGTNQALLVNVTAAVGACALDAECMAVIDKLDGVRLLWSLLKSANPSVQASAAWAICPCIENAKDAGEMVRSFVGGLELIVSLLKSDNPEVLASVCAAIANIAKDEENLAVITDHGVVPMLAKLTTTKHDRLRKHLAEAIARCCRWGNNRIAFGGAHAVAPLVKYLKSPDEQVHRSTAQALHQLSMDRTTSKFTFYSHLLADNCIAMHENGVVQLLLGMVGSSDEELQEAAAGCIGNIRRLALASEKAALK